MKRLISIILGCAIFLNGVSFFYAHADDKRQELSNIFWPAPPAEPRIFFVKNFYGSKTMEVRENFFKKVINFVLGAEKWNFSRPMDVAVGKEGILYVADGGSGEVVICDLEKRKIQRINRIDKNICLVSPVGIAVDKDLIFVADAVLKKVFAINKKGISRFTLDEKEGIVRPAGLFAGGNKLYVVDTEASKVSVFDFRGKFLFSFGKRGKGEGEFNFPTYAGGDAQGRIYISDTLNFRVQIFDSEGRFIKSIGQLGDSSGSFARPKGVAVDSYGHIFVVDAAFDNIQIFDYAQQFLMNFSQAGDADGEFWLPSGIDIDENNMIYVADSYNHRVSVFRYVGGE